MIKQIPQPNMAYRAAAGLREAIREGSYGDEGRLPAEPLLSAQLGVSRGTVREAVSILEQEGLVFRKQGLGTFVIRALSGLTNNLNSNFGVSDLIISAGKTPGTVGVDVSERRADDQLAAYLDIVPGSPVVRIERTRTADSRPVAHTTDMLSLELLRNHGIEPPQLEVSLRANEFALRNPAFGRHCNPAWCCSAQAGGGRSALLPSGWRFHRERCSFSSISSTTKRTEPRCSSRSSISLPDCFRSKSTGAAPDDGRRIGQRAR